jgi:pyridoxal 5-phosphate dependent beta-lyase
MLAIAPALAERLRPRLPPPEWDLPSTVMDRLEHGENNLAARGGLSVALGEFLAAGPQNIRDGLARLGRLTRDALAGLDGWRVVEPADEPTAITTLIATKGADPQQVSAWLIAERGIVTTYAELQRAPFEMTAPMLRVSPHVDTTPDDLAVFAEALAEATAQV